MTIFRNLTFHSEVSYVKTKKEEDNESKEDEELYKQIKGSLSTKVEAVVKTLIKIQTLDPNAKSLVFSTWNGVLDILGEALDQNDIHYSALQAQQGKFKRNLQKFKNREDVKVLLIPLKSGANGLNLVEASHVLLGNYLKL
jgi:E3 ubiquitin-protein ligase SHPRH